MKRSYVGEERIIILLGYKELFHYNKNKTHRIKEEPGNVKCTSIKNRRCCSK